MNQRYCVRLVRVYIILLILCALFFWLIPSNKKNINEIISYDNFIDNHIYPPPWYISNWTINDYFIRKDRLKYFQDQNTKDNEKYFLNKNRLDQSNYLILEYTKVFNKPKFCGKTQDFIFGKQCPYKNCKYTCNQNLINQSDVLLMHRSDIHFNELPKERNSEQIWLFWHDEPGGVQKELVSLKFNWTISYRLDSEINLGAYGLTILRNKILSLNNFNSYINKEFNKRESNIIWFVSNCQPKARLNYYKNLQNFYSFIKVYGNCILINQTNHCYRQSKCEISQLKNNKYYLAFESQSCRDYITEKFWRSLSYGIIPIVFGPKNKQSLEKIAPPNSFIYTGDFNSIEQLAKHLNDINQNQTLFSQYHQWRRFYQVFYQAKDIEYYRFCELCYRLNINRKRIYYKDLNQFFSQDC